MHNGPITYRLPLGKKKAPISGLYNRMLTLSALINNQLLRRN